VTAAGVSFSGRLVEAGRRFLRSRWAPYVIPGTLALAATQTWFRFGHVLGGGDNPPPLAPHIDYRSLWTDFSEGSGAVSRDIILLPYYEGIRLLGPESFQRLWWSAAVVGCALAVVYFARGLGLGPLAAGTAGLFGAFNPYFLTNKIFLAPRPTLIAAGLLGGIVLRVARNGVTVRWVLAFTLGSLLASIIFVNPPGAYLVVISLGVSVAATIARYGRAAIMRLVRFGLVVAIPVLLVNLWWIVPAWLSLHGGDARPVTAPGPLAWIWVTRRSSLGNILGLSTTWAWPEYYPFAKTLDGFPFSVLHYALPLLAVIGLVLARRPWRRAFAVLLAAALVLAWLTKGLHPPARDASLWLYQHVPGLWLLRDPEKTLVVLVLVVVVLAGYGVARLVHSRGLGGAGFPIALTLVAGALVYVFPFYTGFKATLSKPHQHSSAVVRIPSYYGQMARVLDNAPGGGRILALPEADYYQVPFTWDYYGLPIWRFVFDRPLIASGSGGGSYQTTSAEVTQLAREVQSSLIGQGGRGVAQQLRALDVAYVLVSGDVNWRRRGRHLASPQLLDRVLARTTGLHLYARRGSLALYAVDRAPGDVYAAQPVAYRGPAWLQPAALAAAKLPVTTALVTGTRPGAGRTIRLRAPAPWSAVRVTRSADQVAVAALGAPGGKADLPSVSVPTRPGDLVFVRGRPIGTQPVVPVQPTGAVPVDVFRPLRKTEPAVRQRFAESCALLRARLDSAGAIPGSVTTGGCTGFVAALGGSTSTMHLVARVPRTASLVLCIVPALGACTPLKTTHGHVDRFVFVPARRAYAAVIVDRRGSARAQLTMSQYGRTRHAVLHRPTLVTATDSENAPSIAPAATAVVRCPVIDGISAHAVGVDRGADGSLVLHAGTKPACAALAPIPVIDGARYRVTLAQRTPTHRVLRLCVWQTGAGTCKQLPNPRRGDSWQPYEAVFLPGVAATTLRLLAYTPGDSPETISQVRGLRLAPAQPDVSLTVPAGAPVPKVEVRSRSSTRVRVRVHDARGPYLLVLPQTFANGWKLDKPWKGLQPRHVSANGWANAWLISQRGTYDLTLRYEPARYAVAAQKLDLVLVPIVLVAWLAVIARDALVRRRRAA
jgi:hypothetical protein